MIWNTAKGRSRWWEDRESVSKVLYNYCALLFWYPWQRENKLDWSCSDHVQTKRKIFECNEGYITKKVYEGCYYGGCLPSDDDKGVFIEFFRRLSFSNTTETREMTKRQLKNYRINMIIRAAFNNDRQTTRRGESFTSGYDIYPFGAPNVFVWIYQNIWKKLILYKLESEVIHSHVGKTVPDRIPLRWL